MRHKVMVVFPERINHIVTETLLKSLIYCRMFPLVFIRSLSTKTAVVSSTPPELWTSETEL